VILALFLVAPLLGVLAFAVRSAQLRSWLVVAGGIANAVATLIAVAEPEVARAGWLMIDPLSRVFLGFIGVQYLITTLYVPAYLAVRADRPNRVFCGAMLVLPGVLALCCLSHHLGLMWVAMALTTLCAMPLVYFTRTPRALEATWKYLMVGSVGIAIALFGSFFLAYSALHAKLGASLLFDDLIADATKLSKPWLAAALVALIVGYGTKMGIAPMHTWKPDAYGEAPGVVGTLLAGSVTACAFLAILRFVKIAHAAGEGTRAQELLILLGLVSMVVAAIFMVRQRDIKRLLAYSSVEHMGILVFAVGIGGLATVGAMMHLVANGLGKGIVFLTAGNIERIYNSKSTDDVHGAIHRIPWSGWLFLLGFFAITAAPPSALFASELQILRGAFRAGDYLEGAIFLVVLAVVFLGMGGVVLKVVHGTPLGDAPRIREPSGTILPAVLFLLLVIALGLWQPAQLADAYEAAARYVEHVP
jgi:hydrogenase-4 component F